MLYIESPEKPKKEKHDISAEFNKIGRIYTFIALLSTTLTTFGTLYAVETTQKLKSSLDIKFAEKPSEALETILDGSYALSCLISGLIILKIGPQTASVAAAVLTFILISSQFLAISGDSGLVFGLSSAGIQACRALLITSQAVFLSGWFMGRYLSMAIGVVLALNQSADVLADIASEYFFRRFRTLFSPFLACAILACMSCLVGLGYSPVHWRRWDSVVAIFGPVSTQNSKISLGRKNKNMDDFEDEFDLKPEKVTLRTVLNDLNSPLLWLSAINYILANFAISVFLELRPWILAYLFGAAQLAEYLPLNIITVLAISITPFYSWVCYRLGYKSVINTIGGLILCILVVVLVAMGSKRPNLTNILFFAFCNLHSILSICVYSFVILACPHRSLAVLFGIVEAEKAGLMIIFEKQKNRFFTISDLKESKKRSNEIALLIVWALFALNFVVSWILMRVDSRSGGLLFFKEDGKQVEILKKKVNGKAMRVDEGSGGPLSLGRTIFTVGRTAFSLGRTEVRSAHEIF